MNATLAATFLCLAAATAVAAPPPPADLPLPLFVPSDDPFPKGTPVSVRFAPPLDTPVRYQREEQVGGSVHRQELLVRFTRLGDGYRMTPLPPSSTAGLPPRLRLALLPFTLRLGRDGGLESVEDADAYWAASDALLGGLRATPASAAEAATLIAERASVRSLDPVTMAYVVAEAYAPITLMGRLQVTVGGMVEIPAHPGYNAAVPEQALTRSVTFTARSATPRRLRMEVRAEYDEAASLRIAERLGGAGAAARVKAKGARIVETSVHEVQPATGLALFHEDVFTLVAGADSETLRTVRFSRLE